MRIGTPELLLVLLIVVVLFGPSQIPKLARTLGKGVRDFRRGMAEDDAAEEQEHAPEKQDTGS